ncbi:hypothetical protein OEA41_003526 [Lepraria neglecta]|uniref:Plasma membrane proteolipid 3 n=1 Tax=Lepraria neglecta TaxID=209136 RepID=A0AAD9Z7X6_9LECA|nr:hypothetical protein OEA41_003526 [Lepraria neglecta]
MANALSAIVVVIVTIFIPPLGVFLIAGCGADLLINICLTLLGYFPGHIHAFYLEYVYYDRKDKARLGGMAAQQRAPGVYSQNIQTGGHTNYGTVPVQ